MAKHFDTNNLDIDLKVNQGSLSSQMSFLVGRVLTIIDASIADPRQNKALKDILEKEIWDKYNFMLEIWGGKGSILASSNTRIKDL